MVWKYRVGDEGERSPAAARGRGTTQQLTAVLLQREV